MVGMALMEMCTDRIGHRHAGNSARRCPRLLPAHRRGRGLMYRVSHRHITGFLLATLLLSLLLPSSAARTVRAAGTTYYVGNYVDDPGTNTAHCADPNNIDCSLRSAINAATSGGDTIVWIPRATGQSVLTHGTLTLAHSVTIQGPGADIEQVSGGYAVTVFTVNNGVTVVISGVTIENGHASFGGGGIDSSGNLTLTDCVVTNNTVTSTGTVRGGGIIASGALTLTNTTISNNTITSTGAVNGFDISGPAIFWAGTSAMTISASTISGNAGVLDRTGAGPSGQGDAAVTIAFGSANMRDSTISGNTAATGANMLSSGAISMLNPQGTVTVTNSTLSDNRTGSYGGGIYTQGTLVVVSSTITRNHADTSGGIYVSFGSTTLTDTLIAGNTGSTGDGQGNIATASTNNLIGDGSNFSGISNGTNGNQVGTHGSPIDAKLDPAGLQPNGGGPQTIALQPNSAAIEAGGACPNGVTTDERGQPRVGSCDVGAYEYQPVAPTIADASGPVTGGSITFHGSGFQTGSRLTLGSPFSAIRDAPASGVSADGTSMTLDVPASAVAGPVSGGMTVTNPGLPPSARAAFTYLPAITGLNPASGPMTGGGSVTIAGAGFAAGATSVTFGGTSAAVRVDSGAQLTVTVPAHAAGAVDITVTVNGASATKTGVYTYGTAAVLPPAKPAGDGSGSPVTLPGSRPVISSPASGTPNPLPYGR